MIWDRLGVISDEVSTDFIDEHVARVSREVAQRDLSVSAIASPLFKRALDPSRSVASGDMFGQAEESVESISKSLRSHPDCRLYVDQNSYGMLQTSGRPVSI